MAEKKAIIFNPSAGRGKALRRKDRVIECLDARNIQYDLFVTKSEAHLVETTVKIIPDYPVIIGAGGDTTINIIANQIIGREKGNVLGVISLGSTNDLAREIGVNKLEHACDAISSGVFRSLDVGYITTSRRNWSHTFLAQACLGLGVVVNRYVTDWMMRHSFISRFHSLAQLLAGMSAIHNSFKTKSVPMKLELESSDGSRSVNSPLLIFSNTGCFAGRFKPSPWASPMDGKLDCSIFNSTTFPHFFKTALQVNSQKHLADNKVEILQDSYFKIHSHLPFEFQVDGEVVQSDGEIEIFIKPGALKTITSPDYSPKLRATGSGDADE